MFLLLSSALACAELVGGGCSTDDAIVGGECAAGYAKCGSHRCCLLSDGPLADGQGDATMADAPAGDGVPGDSPLGDVLAEGDVDGQGDGFGGDGEAGYVGDGSASDGLASDGPSGDTSSGGDGPTGDSSGSCAAPNQICGGVCTDVMGTDPRHCGSCNVSCPAGESCNAGRCGRTNGGVVYVGYDYSSATPSSSSPGTILTNAVGIARKPIVNILSYEANAQPAAVSQVDALLSGPQYAITPTSDPTYVPASLQYPSYDVLLVHDQTTAAHGALGTLGANWASTLSTFVSAGGVVIILDGGTGTGEMYSFSTSTKLLTVSGPSVIPPDTTADVSSAGDAVGVGVFWPYGVYANSVSFSTDPPSVTLSYVVTVDEDGAFGPPIVVHKTF